jgi:hypothetical protein
VKGVTADDAPLHEEEDREEGDGEEEDREEGDGEEGDGEEGDGEEEDREEEDGEEEDGEEEDGEEEDREEGDREAIGVRGRVTDFPSRGCEPAVAMAEPETVTPLRSPPPPRPGLRTSGRAAQPAQQAHDRDPRAKRTGFRFDGGASRGAPSPNPSCERPFLPSNRPRQDEGERPHAPHASGALCRCHVITDSGPLSSCSIVAFDGGRSVRNRAPVRSTSSMTPSTLRPAIFMRSSSG